MQNGFPEYHLTFLNCQETNKEASSRAYLFASPSLFYVGTYRCMELNAKDIMIVINGQSSKESDISAGLLQSSQHSFGFILPICLRTLVNICIYNMQRIPKLPPYNPFPTEETLLRYRVCIGIFMADF